MSTASAAKSERHGFQAEVSRLLHLMTHSVYSQKEIFLRELISNGSDACDRLRYLALTKPELVADDPAFAISIRLDKTGRRLVVEDNGIGMDRQELIDNLGTIARSGTKAFADQLTGDSAQDLSLIGQFGVGFYSAFMVAKSVAVVSRKAGAAEAWRWTSDGLGAFEIEPAERAGRGTTVTLELRQAEDEYLDPFRVKAVVKSYSDHIALPIRVQEGDQPAEQANAAAALWTRPRTEITEQQLTEFYHHVAHAGDSPWLTLHARAEGRMEYALLLFVPAAKPFDLYTAERKHRVKLYVKRVFITDDAQGLVPPYLRFLKGVVDSADLPLNISREMLQNNPVLGRLREAVTKRVLAELLKKAEDPADYAKFWDNFGAVLKEGLYEDFERREDLVKLLRARSTVSGEALASLDDYVGRMKEGQNEIWFVTGEDREALARSPQIEGFRARGIEVLLLTDPVDDFWVSAVREYKGKTFKSATRGSAELEKFAKLDADRRTDEPKPEAEGAALATLVAAIKQALGAEVKDVRPSQRLTDSAVCLVADDKDMDLHLARVLKAHKQIDKLAPRVLEINPAHPLILALAARVKSAGADAVIEPAHLLLDQARILEGETVADAVAFARRMSEIMTRSLG
ncbi:MAG: molecular chaperone HtpG [Alphaproteobacteria bacterium]|nr:molecular chaperone HtpG [Alphaproteobacteria bacterium]